MSKEQIAISLQRLESRNGRLSPADVVEEASDPKSPLHSHFTWDDTEAAEMYRLEQARTLIRLIKVEITVHDMPLSVNKYLRDPDMDANSAGYRNIVKIRSEADAARAAVTREMQNVANAASRAKVIAKVLGTEEDIEHIETLARSVLKRVSTAGQPAGAA